MIAVAFYAEARTNCGKQIRFDLWEGMARSFGVDTLICIDQLNFECFYFKCSDVKSALHVHSLKEIYDLFPNAKRVYVEKDGPVIPTELHKYTHPEEDVIYFFGGNSGGFRKQVPKDSPGDWVVIPTNHTTGLWAEQASIIMMADRWHRGNNR